MYNIGWFSSGRGAGSRALLTTMVESILQGDVKARISFVFCNRERGLSEETDAFLDLVKSYDIPLICCSSLKFREGLSPEAMATWRADYDHEVMKQLAPYQADLCVLAGYMLVASPDMCRHYTMINLHPAAPGGPKGTWKEVIWELIEHRAPTSGVMMHLVTPELDEGPPVTFCTYSLQGEPFDKYWQILQSKSLDRIKAREGEDFELFKRIRQHGLKREFPLIVATVKAFSRGSVHVENGRIIDRGGNAIKGYDLTSEIDQIVT